MRRVIAALVLLVPTVSAGASDKTLFIELESRVSVSPLPAAVSDTGAMIVGNLNGGGGFYWMPTTGAIFNGGLFATDVSADGRTIVGVAPEVRGGVRNPAIWQRATEWRLLGGFGPPCDDSLSAATGTSRDGKVVVGWARNGCAAGHAFRWEESTGLVDLGSSVAGRPSEAHGVSGDGHVVVGEQVGADSFRGASEGWTAGRKRFRANGAASGSPLT